VRIASDTGTPQDVVTALRAFFGAAEAALS
jgi:hypothetical protein